MTAKGLRRSDDSSDREWSDSKQADPDAPGVDSGSAAPPAEWNVNVEGREIVSMSAAEIVLKLRAGELSRQSLAWREGMDEWTALEALPAFALAAPVSSRPAASESRPKAPDEEPPARPVQRTEIGLQPPVTPVIEEASLESYDPEGATTVRTLPDVPLEEATVILRDAETLPPAAPGPAEEGAVSARGDELAGALAVYERPVATLAFPEMDAPNDEETVVSDPPASTSEPPLPPSARPAKATPSTSASAKTEDPPVPPLPKLPSRALVSTAAAAFMPPARSPSGAPRLSSLGPATGNRPSSPSSPSITRKPLVPSSPAPASKSEPLVQALLALTADKGGAKAPVADTPAAATPPESTPPVETKAAAPAPAEAELAATSAAAAVAPAAAAPPPPPARVSSTPPAAPSAKATAKAPSAPPIRVKPETPVMKMEPAAPRSDAPPPRSDASPPRFVRQYTPAETPIARASERPPALQPDAPTPAETPVARASERPPALEGTPTPVVAAVSAPQAATVTSPVAPAVPLPADSDPVNEALPPPPPLPAREPANLASLGATTTPTIILREDRDADTQVTYLRAGRSVPLRKAVAAGAASTFLGSLITGLIVSSLQPEPPKALPQPTAAVTVTAAPLPAPAPEPPKPAVDQAAAAAPSAAAATIPSVSARELAAEKKTENKPKKSATAWTPPKPKPKPVDPEVALPDEPASATSAPSDKKPSSTTATDPDSADPSADKNKAAWETSPGPGF